MERSENQQSSNHLSQSSKSKMHLTVETIVVSIIKRVEELSKSTS